MDDSKIIDLFFERSEDAIVVLSKKYGSVFMQVSMNILNNRKDAEECINDSYLGVWNAIPPKKPNPLLSFVCRIVRNISINRYNDVCCKGWLSRPLLLQRQNGSLVAD